MFLIIVLKNIVYVNALDMVSKCLPWVSIKCSGFIPECNVVLLL